MERSPYAIALVLLACSTPANAQYVYKCSSGSQVSYQSEPCNGTPARVWHALAEVVDPAIAEHNARIREQMDMRAQGRSPARQRSSQAVGAAIGIARDQRACDRARTERGAAFERLGTRRTFEQSRYWDNRVYDACR